jgi:hypothetical protein
MTTPAPAIDRFNELGSGCNTLQVEAQLYPGNGMTCGSADDIS